MRARDGENEKEEDGRRVGRRYGRKTSKVGNKEAIKKTESLCRNYDLETTGSICLRRLSYISE